MALYPCPQGQHYLDSVGYKKYRLWDWDVRGSGRNWRGWSTEPLENKSGGGDDAMQVYDSPTQRLAIWFHSTGAEASSHCHRLRTVSWTRFEVLCSWILMSYIKRISFVNLGPGSCSCRRWHRVLSSVKLKLRASTWGAIDDVIFRGKKFIRVL